MDTVAFGTGGLGNTSGPCRLDAHHVQGLTLRSREFGEVARSLMTST